MCSAIRFIRNSHRQQVRGMSTRLNCSSSLPITMLPKNSFNAWTNSLTKWISSTKRKRKNSWIEGSPWKTKWGSWLISKWHCNSGGKVLLPRTRRRMGLSHAPYHVVHNQLCLFQLPSKWLKKEEEKKVSPLTLADQFNGVLWWFVLVIYLIMHDGTSFHSMCMHVLGFTWHRHLYINMLSKHDPHFWKLFITCSNLKQHKVCHACFIN